MTHRATNVRAVLAGVDESWILRHLFRVNDYAVKVAKVQGVVPHGVEHRPVSSDGAEIVLMEPADTVNTGD